MWTLTSLIFLLDVCCAVSAAPPTPVNVRFSSMNLRNVLHWVPRNGTPFNTHFTVEYAIYGDSIEGIKGRRVNWKNVWQCTNIFRTWCDLSNETWDVEHGYYARVRAVGKKSSSKWANTPRFDPKSDTTFGPPLVSLEMENNSVIITLVGPMRYPANNHSTDVSMAAVYPHMKYKMYINNTHRNQMHGFSVPSIPYKYPVSDYNTEYCFSAESTFLSMPVECQLSAWHCITTPHDPLTKQLQKVIVGVVVPFLCLCIIIILGSILRNYLTGKGQKSPFTLNPPSFHPPPLTFTPDNLNIFLISVVKDDPPCDSSCSDPKISDPPPGYSPQRFETPPLPEEPWDDFSGSYGGVIAVKETGPDEGHLWTDVVGGGGNTQGKKDEEGIYAPQAKSCFLQMGNRTFKPTHVQREVSTLEQGHPWSQVKSTLPTQLTKQFQHNQECVTEELNNREHGRPSGLFVRKNAQTGLFNVLSGLPAKEIVTEMKGGDEEEGCKCENVPLLSTYAQQNNKNIPMSHSNQPDCCSEDQGLLGLVPTQQTEDNFTDEDEMEGTIHVNWDPQTKKLVLPEMEMRFKVNDTSDGLVSSESWRNERIAGENVMNASGVGLQLENVFVSQTSGEDTEEEDVFSEWGLVIPGAQ